MCLVNVFWEPFVVLFYRIFLTQSQILFLKIGATAIGKKWHNSHKTHHSGKKKSNIASLAHFASICPINKLWDHLNLIPKRQKIRCRSKQELEVRISVQVVGGFVFLSLKLKECPLLSMKSTPTEQSKHICLRCSFPEAFILLKMKVKNKTFYIDLSKHLLRFLEKTMTNHRDR